MSNPVIAALFVMDNGPYANDPRFDAWGVHRDARLYNGNLPVIAHPPCQLWGKLARVNYSRWGGEHNRPGNDGGCFRSALGSVNRCGGVLEHPAQTYAWREHGLATPKRGEWIKSGMGWVCEVFQSAYGHRARKATWLYYVGKRPPYDLIWVYEAGSCQVGFADSKRPGKNKPTLSKREANETPKLFLDELVKLALLSSLD